MNYNTMITKTQQKINMRSGSVDRGKSGGLEGHKALPRLWAAN
jgi:hypothetical protein